MRAGDTIVAVATAMGESAVGLIRVSGPAALATAAPLIRGATPLADFPSHRLRRVTVIDPRTGDRLDEALCAVMRGPRSYTGEDVVELSCHGSPALRCSRPARWRARSRAGSGRSATRCST